MANEKNNLWLTWAPFWDQMENRHLNTDIVDQLNDHINGPVLVIGAGQGLIVKYLKEAGYQVTGIDQEDKMVEYARTRHGLKIIQADARQLPLPDSRFKTVIIATGVADYMTEDQEIKQVLAEAVRVLAPNGYLLINFYQLLPRLARFYRKTGVIDSNNIYHMKRIFKIDELSQKNPIYCVPYIMKWTQKQLIPVFLYWIKVGISLPFFKELKAERRMGQTIFRLARENQINENEIKAAIPEAIPYRDFKNIQELLDRIDFIYQDMQKFKECIVVKYHKSNLINLVPREKTVTSPDWIIQAANLTKKYKHSPSFALKKINLTIDRAIIYGILGPNGAGKTTTLSILAGLLKQTSGSLKYIASENYKDIQQKMGFIPQDLALYDKLSAYENLEFFGQMYQVRPQKLKSKIQELLQIVGLTDRAHDRIKNYSTGMKRRLNLAAGLIHDPEIILMDEPTVGIDPQSRNCIYETVLKLKQQGVTILYTTHYMEEADKLCDQVAIMDQGKIILEGNPGLLVNHYGLSRLQLSIEGAVNPNFITALSRLAAVFNIDRQGQKLLISIKNNVNHIETIEKITRAAHNYQTKIALTSVTKASLESLFLDITGRNLRDITAE